MALKIRAVRAFEASGRNCPTTQRISPEYLLTQYENRFATNKTFQNFVISSG
jgi:hypothetical protein